MQYKYRNKEIIVIFDYFDQRKLWDMIRECDAASGGVTPQTPADEISGRGEICACIFGENRVYYTGTCRCVGIGRRSGLKIHRWQHRAGSSPATGTIKAKQYRCRRPEAYGINCSRAFSPRKFTDDSIDANHCFPLTGGTRTPICSEVGKIKTMWCPF